MIFKGIRLFLVLSVLFYSTLAVAQDLAQNSPQNLTKNQESDPYIINDVLISSDGASPTEARAKAIAEGQRNAFMILLERLKKSVNLAANLGDEDIDTMVASKQIIDETIAGNKYSASLNLSFSESFVKYYLGGENENKIEDGQEKHLLVPVKIFQDEFLIWEEKNDWKNAFEKLVINNKLLPIRLPKGDEEDILELNSNNISDVDFSGIENILEKYHADRLIIAYFDFDNIENKVNITLKTIRKFKIEKVRLEFLNVNQLNSYDLMNKVAGRTYDYLVSKENSDEPIIPSVGVVDIDIDILVNGINEWMIIKHKLENQNIISNLIVNSISQDLIKTKATYDGKNGEIISFFAKHNLFLQRKSEGGYFLSLKNLR